MKSIHSAISATQKRLSFTFIAGATAMMLLASGCKHSDPGCCPLPAGKSAAVPEKTKVTSNTATAAVSVGKKASAPPKRFTYTPRPYPVDERGFSPVDKALANAYAKEEMVTDDAEGSLNPYVMKVISGFPLDGSYPYHCGWTPREYDIYNGVTQDMWFKGMVVAKAYPDGSRCSYCCGFTFEVFIRAMKLRNIQKGLDEDEFNNMTFHDLFNMLQFWYIEGKGDNEVRAVSSYGLGHEVTNFEEARPGDFLSYSTTPPGGHAVIFIDWLRDENKKIVGLKYFSSNLSGTHGVGYGQGHFSDSTPTGKGLLRNSVHIAHVGAIKDYKAFDRAQIPARNAYLPTQPSRILYVPAPTEKSASAK